MLFYSPKARALWERFEKWLWRKTDGGNLIKGYNRCEWEKWIRICRLKMARAVLAMEIEWMLCGGSNT